MRKHEMFVVVARVISFLISAARCSRLEPVAGSGGVRPCDVGAVLVLCQDGFRW